VQLAPCDLQPLNEVGRPGKEHSPSVLDQREAEGCREMALASAWRPEPQQIVLHKMRFLSGNRPQAVP
jgi:hypothetical protein